MSAYYSRIILYAFRYLLFSKLCWHNLSRPTLRTAFVDTVKMNYSGTSLNGPSQKRTTSLERTNTKAPIDFSMHLM